jgi:copper chaperone CopZ
MQTEYLTVTGMTCLKCTRTVARALNEVAGVGDVDVSLVHAEATIHFNERLTSLGELEYAVEAAGYGVDFGRPVHTRHPAGGHRE